MPDFALKITPTAPDVVTAVTVSTLTRSDTGAAPAGVTLPLTLSLVGGMWVGTFTDASPPASYAYTLTLTFDDGSTETTGAGFLSGALTGIYGSIADIVMEVGRLNSDIFSDPDNLQDASEMILHKQQAIDFADSTINMVLQRYSFTTPATASLTALRFCFAKLGAYQLYQVRGLQDKAKGTSGAFQAKYDWAQEQLEELTFMNRGGFTRISGYSDAPTGVGPTVNSNGQTIRTRPYCDIYGRWVW